MFGKNFVADMITRSAENEADRRVFLKAAGVGGLGVVGATAAGALGSSANAAETATEAATDGAVLNFALNLEYLEAEFYLNAVFGHGLAGGDIGGKGRTGSVTGGGRPVPFKTPAIQKYALEIASDEQKHVKFLRKALGKAKVSRPPINISNAFAAAASAAGLGDGFDVYANETNFLLGAFIFEDVGVTAYKGAAPLITNKAYLEAAAGILSVEAYHAGIVRTTLYRLAETTPSLFGAVQAISDARDSLDGSKHYDRGIGTAAAADLVPTNKNAIAFGRSPGQVLNIVYLNPKSVKKGGFFPNGVNGAVNKSS